MSIAFSLSRKTAPLKLQKRVRTPAAPVAHVAPAAKPFDVNAMLGKVANLYFAGLRNPAQQASDARSTVDASLKQSIAAMTAAGQPDIRAANLQALRSQGFAEGLRTLSPTMGAQIQSYYNDAANQIRNFGTGLTGAVSDTQQGDVNKAQGDVAAATGGLGVVGGLNVPDLHSIAQYTGVALPSATLQGQGANMAANEYLQNVANSQRIGDLATGYDQQALNAKLAIQDKIAALQATRPDLLQSAITSARGGNTQDLAALASALTLQGTLSQIPGKIAGQTATTGLTTAKTGATKAGTKVSTAKASGVTPTGNNPAPGNYWVGKDPKTRVSQKIPPHSILDPNDPTHSHLLPDPYNPPPRMHYDPATGTFVLNPSVASTKTIGKKPVTASQINTILNSANKNIAKGIIGPPYTKVVPGTEYKPGGPVYEPTGGLTAQQARAQLLRTYFPRALWKNVQAIGLVNTALAKAGYKV